MTNGKLSLKSRDILTQPRFSIKAPNGFSLGGEYWTDYVAILSYGPDGRLEIAYPSYNTRPTSAEDLDAERALAELTLLLEAAMIDIYIEPGDWIVWDNSVLAHRRGLIGDGRRLLWRNNIRRNCDAMREATGTSGPIFSARVLLNTQTSISEGERHAG